MESKQANRRDFIKGAATVAAASALGAGFILKSCSTDRTKVVLPGFLDKAPDGRVLKAGLIGCGGRGTGAAFNLLDAGDNLQVTALADVFQDRLDRCRQQLKDRMNVEIADEKCFVGFDAYQKVIESDVDISFNCHSSFFPSCTFRCCSKSTQTCIYGKTCGC
jgi:myo-inositol 2-dehydrogenase / D-chiro-inositol 1-dehydrogenase